MSLTTGTITAVNQTVTLPNCPGGLAAFEFSGTYSGVTLTFAISPDGNTYAPLLAIPQGGGSPSTSSVQLSTNQSAVFEATGIPPGSYIQITCIAYTSGTCNVLISCGPDAVIASRADIRLTPTISSTAYAAGSAIGGVQTLVGAARQTGAGVTLAGLLITDKSGSTPPLKILVFNSSPSSPSVFTDHSGAVVSQADLATKLCAEFTVAAADYTTVVTDTGSQVGGIASYGMPKLGQSFPAGSSNNNLYMGIILTSAVTFLSTGDLGIVVTVFQD